jgi:hypothetical protein
LLQDSGLPAEDRFSAVLREAESSAVLDMMTGGWFGAYRAALAARAPSRLLWPGDEPGKPHQSRC